MSALRRAAEEYLAMRRSLGYRLVNQGRLLANFIGYLERAGATTITIEAAVAWASESPEVTAICWNRRLSVVRCFARYLTAYDPACQVPPTDLFPARGARRIPYLYSDAEIEALVHAAGTLAVPLQAATCQALIGLLAASGLRVGEAIALTRHDVDLDAALVTVMDGKFGASRHVPIHPTTVAMLRGYLARRDRYCPAPATDRFFISTIGTPVLAGSVEGLFTRLLSRAGITAPPGRRPPRLHDLRHTFAVATLLEWYRAGVDVQARLPLLSTVLGHVAPASTYWYLTATPELLALASRRMEDHLGVLP